MFNSLSATRSAVLVVSAIDSMGMSGLVRDTHTIAALGAHPLLCSTASTIQNHQGECVVFASPDQQFDQQLRHSFDDNTFDIVKSGALTSVYQVEKLAALLAVADKKLVADPVFFTSKNNALLCDQGIEAYRLALLPHCYLLTPNIDEASLLTGMTIASSEDMEKAASKLLSMGVKHVLIKGGHLQSAIESTSTVSDYFCSDETSFWLSNNSVETDNSRGTGCTLASAIAASLAMGHSVLDAVVIGKMAIHNALEHAYSYGEKGPVNVSGFPTQLSALPKLTRRFSDVNQAVKFPAADLPCGNKNTSLGIYPVVDSSQWIERLLPLGISTIQLRIKDQEGEALYQEIKRSVELAEKYNARLFINDHWQLAIKAGAYGVHLGQEDIETADIAAIHQAGLRLGLSTHCFYEVARAHALRPSYMACGPIFHTDTKDMPWIPQGYERLRYWRQLLQEYPLVAIGGIKDRHIREIRELGVDSIAMITAITESDQPEQQAREMIDAFSVEL